jgi:endogenous inhibitor of DNA gyrase (YacG/DUF329 family)
MKSSPVMPETGEAEEAGKAKSATPFGPCPICHKPAVEAERPFCSRRCTDIDLGRWLKGDYAIPVSEPGSSIDAQSAGDSAGAQEHASATPASVTPASASPASANNNVTPFPRPAGRSSHS